MASIWHILGLPGPTHDAKAIKRAYAAKLKITRPEDDPAGFMALREAFNAAKRYARFNAPRDDAPAPDTVPNPISVPIETPETIARDPDSRPDLTPAINPARLPIIEPQEQHPDITPARVPLLPIIEKTENAQPPAAPPVGQGRTKADILSAIHVLISGANRDDAGAWQSVLREADDLSVHDYAEFEYDLTDCLLNLYDYDARGDKKPHLFTRANRPIKTDTLKLIYRHMGWNEEPMRPEPLQQPLKWLVYEGGILKRPKSEKPYVSPWRKDLIGAGWRLAIIGVLALMTFFTMPARNTGPMLPASGEAQYGRYETMRDAGTYRYYLNQNHPDVMAMTVDSKLYDSFTVQFQPALVEHINVQIFPSGQQEDIIKNAAQIRAAEILDDINTLRGTPERAASQATNLKTKPKIVMTGRTERTSETMSGLNAFSIAALMIFSCFCLFFFARVILTGIGFGIGYSYGKIADFLLNLRRNS